MQDAGRKMILAKRMKSLHSEKELPIQDLCAFAIRPLPGTAGALLISGHPLTGTVKTQEVLLGAHPDNHTHLQ